ncbi:contactin-5-like [Haliotis rufescens]|uniref:contactin-5-like n=1 Tax=Haliotis rufescens TaxID=6454 RepID=UPI00201E839C|nr:contactin-5-like [Haliotis rufescens]
MMDRKPKVMFHSGTIKSELGEDVQLECIFSGRPLPKISWTRSDEVLKSRGRVLVSHGFVVIKNVTEADHGVYTCTGENIAGSESSSVTFDVLRTSNTDVSVTVSAVTVAVSVVALIAMVLCGLILGVVVWHKKTTARKSTARK